MYVAVQPSGTIVFRLDHRLNGRRETQTLGWHGSAGLSVARAGDRSLSRSEIRIMLNQFEHVPILPTIRLGVKMILPSMLRNSELQDAS